MNEIILIVLKSIIKCGEDIIKIIFTNEYGNNNNGEKNISFLGFLLIFASVLIALIDHFTSNIDANASKEPSYTFNNGVITCDEEPDLTITLDNYSIEDVILNSDMHLYTMEELMDFSRDELRLIRNGIFALNGRTFVEEDLSNYYSQFDWYNPVPKGAIIDYSSLSECQRKNVNLIKELESFKRKFNIE